MAIDTIVLFLLFLIFAIIVLEYRFFRKQKQWMKAVDTYRKADKDLFDWHMCHTERAHESAEGVHLTQKRSAALQEVRRLDPQFLREIAHSSSSGS